MSRRNDIQRLLIKHNRRLQVLKEQQAVQGQSVEPKIIIEIQDIETEMAQLQAELATLPEVDETATTAVSGHNDDEIQGGKMSSEEKPKEGGIHFGDHAKVGGDVFTGGKRVINTGGGEYIEGNVATGGGDFVGRDHITHSGADAETMAKAFGQLYQALAQKPDTMQKNMAKQALETLEAEAKKGDQVDESKVKQGLEVILAMLPDIGEVALNTFINPIQGLSTVFQKIAQKAKENAKS